MPTIIIRKIHLQSKKKIKWNWYILSISLPNASWSRKVYIQNLIAEKVLAKRLWKRLKYSMQSQESKLNKLIMWDYVKITGFEVWKFWIHSTRTITSSKVHSMVCCNGKWSNGILIFWIWKKKWQEPGTVNCLMILLYFVYNTNQCFF